MGVARTALATPLVKSRNLDLKWSLTLRVVSVALVCFLIAAALALYDTYRELRQANENLADLVGRHLQVQLFRIDTHTDAPARFPDWDAVVDHVQDAGQCIQYIKPDGGPHQHQQACEGEPSARRSRLRSEGAGTDHVRARLAGVDDRGRWMRSRRQRPGGRRQRAGADWHARARAGTWWTVGSHPA